MSPFEYRELSSPTREALQRASLQTYNVDTGHVLAALCTLADARSTRIFETLGIDPAELLAAVTEVRSSVPSETHHGGFSEETKRALEFAAEEAMAADRADVDPECLLLGLSRSGDGFASLALRRLGVDEGRIRQELPWL